MVGGERIELPTRLRQIRAITGDVVKGRARGFGPGQGFRMEPRVFGMAHTVSGNRRTLRLPFRGTILPVTWGPPRMAGLFALLTASVRRSLYTAQFRGCRCARCAYRNRLKYLNPVDRRVFHFPFRNI